jgi:hypothetical protein
MSLYYIVRHKPTGRTLPARVRATHWEFDMPEGVLEPRLFKTERAAKTCATCWSQGVWHQEMRTESDGWESPSYSYLAEPSPQLVPGRNRDDLEVLPVRLELLS